MYMNPLYLLLAFSVFVSSGQSQTPSPARERFQNADVSYGWVHDNAGHKLRTFTTRPKNVSGRLPVIFFVGWLSCDSVEYPQGEADGFGTIFWRLIEQSKYATVRLDKAGVGESEGDCAKLDFNTELTGYQSAFDEMLKYDFIDPQNVFVVGLSNGGGTSFLIPRLSAVRGYVAVSSWGRTWYEHMLELERVRLSRGGKSPGDVNAGTKAFIGFYDLYLNHAMTPGEVTAQHPEWKAWWYDAEDGQYGRPAAFYQQLQALNLGDAWSRVTVPVLILHGTSDTVMSEADSHAIANSVNATHPGSAQFVTVPAGDHLLSVRGKLVDMVAPAILQWMHDQLRK